MERITDNLALGSCYGISDMAAKSIAKTFGLALTISNNLGGTNNERKFIVDGAVQSVDMFIAAWDHYTQSKR